MNTKVKNAIANAVLVFISILITLAAAEWGYRIYLRVTPWKMPESYDYQLMPSVHNVYNEKYGQTTKPNSECYANYIHNGKVIGGLTNFISNADGLDGKTTFAEYNKADKKILVFGDSFSHWNQGGDSWPDILQTNLNQKTTQKTAILNYATGGYGVLQMLDLAADKIVEKKPDLVIIAIINDDFSRSRWFTKEFKQGNTIRWMLSVNKDNFFDWNYGGDCALISPEATKEWNKQQMASPNPNDTVLKKANALYARLKRSSDSVRLKVPFRHWDHSFIFSKIRTGNPYATLFGSSANGLPRTYISNFEQDERAKDDIKRIVASGANVMLVYMPLYTEFKAKTVISATEPYKGQHVKLMASLERMANTKFYHLENDLKEPLPAKINLEPLNRHPNRTGLELYAKLIKPLVEAKLAGK